MTGQGVQPLGSQAHMLGRQAQPIRMIIFPHNGFILDRNTPLPQHITFIFLLSGIKYILLLNWVPEIMYFMFNRD
jgi:hypothetical protein